MLYILQGLYIVCTLWFTSVVYWCDSWMAFGPLLLNKLIDWVNFNLISSNLTTMLCRLYVVAPVQMCRHRALHPARVCLQCYWGVWRLVGRTELRWVTAPSLHIDITVPPHTGASILGAGRAVSNIFKSGGWRIGHFNKFVAIGSSDCYAKSGDIDCSCCVNYKQEKEG